MSYYKKYIKYKNKYLNEKKMVGGADENRGNQRRIPSRLNLDDTRENQFIQYNEPNTPTGEPFNLGSIFERHQTNTNSRPPQPRTIPPRLDLESIRDNRNIQYDEPNAPIGEPSNLGSIFGENIHQTNPTPVQSRTRPPRLNLRGIRSNTRNNETNIPTTPPAPTTMSSIFDSIFRRNSSQRGSSRKLAPSIHLKDQLNYI